MRTKNENTNFYENNKYENTILKSSHLKRRLLLHLLPLKEDTPTQPPLPLFTWFVPQHHKWHQPMPRLPRSLVKSLSCQENDLTVMQHSSRGHL